MDASGLAGRAMLIADGEDVWSQYRRFEVPAEAAANLRQELQIESGTGEFRVSSALCFPKFVTGAAAMTHELRKAGTSRPKAGVKFAGYENRKRRRQQRLVSGESTEETVKTIAQGMPVMRLYLW